MASPQHRGKHDGTSTSNTKSQSTAAAAKKPKTAKVVAAGNPKANTNPASALNSKVASTTTTGTTKQTSLLPQKNNTRNQKDNTTMPSSSNNSHHIVSSNHHNKSRRSSATWVILQMILCVVGIYACFGLWSLKQERVATKPYDLGNGEVRRFKSPFVLVLVQSVFGASIAAVFVWLTSSWNKSNNNRSKEEEVSGLVKAKSSWIRQLVMIGFCNTFAAPFGYAAMRRLSYPIVTTVKMGKMLPIIIVGSIWHRTSYSLEKYAIVLLISAGVIGFTILEEKDEREEMGRSSSWKGLLLVMVNLVLDGMCASTQDVLVKTHRWSGFQIMLGTNVAAVAYGVVSLLAFECIPQNSITAPELSDAIVFFTRQPNALVDVAVMGLLNALGQVFIFQTIALFGSLTLTAMTLIRKMGTVVLSIYVHEHVLSGPQWSALVVVVLGVLLETRVNIREKTRKH